MRRIFCIGDSNTWGYDPRSYVGGRYPGMCRWTGRLSGWEIVNDGINGARIPCAVGVFGHAASQARGF